MSTPKSYGFLECDGHRILYYVSSRYSAGVKRRVYVYRDLSTGNENRIQELKLAALPMKPPGPFMSTRTSLSSSCFFLLEGKKKKRSLLEPEEPKGGVG
jgi:hypothetical protein